MRSCGREKLIIFSREETNKRIVGDHRYRIDNININKLTNTLPAFKFGIGSLLEGPQVFARDESEIKNFSPLRWWRKANIYISFLFQGNYELLGRFQIQPVIDDRQDYEYAPKLKWYDMTMGAETTGQVLMSVQVLQVKKSMSKWTDYILINGTLQMDQSLMFLHVT